MSIQTSYVVWVGADHYETASAFVEEVRRMGIAKRLPGVGMANALHEPGAVVFLAHDNGEAYDCDACPGKVECSSCRTQLHLIAKWQEEADAVQRRYLKEQPPRGKQRIIDIRGERIAQARALTAECELCGGAGKYEAGTGGYVVRGDGSRLDYRAYSFWVRQPSKFSETVQQHMCTECGGTGKKPDGVIFGAFVPSVEVVVTGREKDIVRDHNKRFAQVSLSAVAKEPERQAERPSVTKRRAGYYAMARAGKPSKRALAVASELSARGVVRACEVMGDVLIFSKPIKAGELKRFRGVKHWALPTGRKGFELSA